MLVGPLGLGSALTSLQEAAARHKSAAAELKAFEDRLLPARNTHKQLTNEMRLCKQVHQLATASNS